MLKENPELLELFKYFRDHQEYWDAEKVPNGIEVDVSGGKAKVDCIAGIKHGPLEENTRQGVFSVMLPNGKKFAFKAGLRANPGDAQELRAAHKARLLGLSTVEHYAAIYPIVPSTARYPYGEQAYFVLMEHKPLPTVSLYPDSTVKREFTRQQKILREAGLYDLQHRNCFFEQLPNRKFKLHWFDLRMRPTEDG